MAQKLSREYRPRILIVDDDKNLCLLYEQELQDEGYDTLSVYSGRGAITEVEKGGIDLVILDIAMPDMDGIETLPHLIRKNNMLPIIFNTAHPDYKDNFMTWSADEFIVKSTDLTELKGTIKEVLEKRVVGE